MDIKYVKDNAGNNFFPLVHEKGVVDNNGTTLESKLQQKQDAISDLSTIRSGAAAGATAVQPATTLAGYGITDGYTKTEVNNLITTPNQEYVSVAATAQTTSVTDVLPATGAADTTYRVGNWDGTQYNDSVFSEYAWNGSAYIKLSTKSQVGEVYDISANHADTKYSDLAAALGANGANIPEAIRKGGMSVKFVQSSDNKYVQYRMMADDWSTDTDDWAIADEGVYVENPEFVYVKTDSEGKILLAIKTDGTIYFGAGVPQQVIDYIEERIADLPLDEYEDIVAFLNDLEKGDKTLQTLLDEKVDKEEGKSLIDNEIVESLDIEEDSEYIQAITDITGRVIEGIKEDGTKKVNTDIEIEGKTTIAGNSFQSVNDNEFVNVETDKDGRILSGTRQDGSHYIYNLQSETLNSKLDFTIEQHLTEEQKEIAKTNLGIDGHNIEEDAKPYFNIDQDGWIADESTKTFYPSTQKIIHEYKGEVSPEKRYIALGFDDFRASDFSFIIPLLEKYGARAEFNRVHRSAGVPSLEDLQRINSIINGKHELGDHTWLHYKFPFDEPYMNGQDPSSIEGSQVPFPSNDQLRNDVGNGKNVFGRTLTNNVKSDLGYQAPDINTTWGAMTDAQCQQLRNYYSVMKDTTTNLVTILDELSNTYLGTTGSSRGSWDSVNEEYTGGIFTGCKTSQNHEIWERILLVTNMFLKDKFGLNYNLITWSLPGSKNSGCYFTYNGVQYFDANHTKRRGNLARFESSLYKNNDNTAKERSWTDVLREFGYKTTHDATPADRSCCMSYQFVINANQFRQDALPHPTNRLMSYNTIASEYTKGTDLTGTAPYEVQMYDGGGSFKNEIEKWRMMCANGVIWGAVIDSNDTWSERMILEGLLKYGAKTGIEFVTHAEAYDICFNHPVKNGNLLYNPMFRNTAKEFMPTAQTVPSNPDGYDGDCSVSTDNDGSPVLTTNGITEYVHYGIPYGKICFSVEGKGTMGIYFRYIYNKTKSSDMTTGNPTFTNIVFNDSDNFVKKSVEFVVPDNGVTAYEDVYGGYGDKIIGLLITIQSGLQLKNIDMRLI